MEIKPATPDDYQDIVTLANRYYVGNLSPEEQKSGFLSVSFTREQIAEMAADPGIIVTHEAQEIVAFLCASSRYFSNPPPFYPEMMQALESISYKGYPMKSYKFFIYGPVCIDSNHRGRGLLRQLYSALLRQVTRVYEVGIAFVAEDNPHSLDVHIKGLNMKIVGDFKFRGRRNYLLAFSVPITEAETASTF